MQGARLQKLRAHDPTPATARTIAFAASTPSPSMGEGWGGGEFAVRCPEWIAADTITLSQPSPIEGEGS